MIPPVKAFVLLINSTGRLTPEKDRYHYSENSDE